MSADVTLCHSSPCHPRLGSFDAQEIAERDATGVERGNDGRLGVVYRNPPLSEVRSKLGLDLRPCRLEDDEDWPELVLDEPEREPTAPYQAR